MLEEDVVDENALEGGVKEASDHMKRMGSDVMENINDEIIPGFQGNSEFVDVPEPLGEIRAATRYNLRRNPVKNKRFYNISLNNIIRY